MPYEKVFAFGDSFTRGDELADCQIRSINGEFGNGGQAYSVSTWPSLIAKELNVEYECRAIGGRGNSWINWSVNQALSERKKCLVVVNWSYFGRFDFLDLDDHWQTITPNHNDISEKEYYKNIDNDLWNLNRNLQLMYSTFSVLENNAIDFISTCHDSAFKSTVDSLRSVNPIIGHKNWKRSLKPLIDFVVPRITEFEELSFRDWSSKHGFPIGPGGHPLEKAHVEAANYINMVTTEGRNNGH